MLRWFHLDLARGLTILGMILVNHPGSWSHIYPPLKHAAWHGLTFADLVFPSFLFLMGTAVAAAHSLKDSPLLTLRSFRRFCLLFALGLALNFIPAMDFHSLRIPGVLQRIAVVYLAVILLRKLPDFHSSYTHRLHGIDRLHRRAHRTAVLRTACGRYMGCLF